MRLVSNQRTFNHRTVIGVSRLERRDTPTATNTLISHADANNVAETAGGMAYPVPNPISGDGRFVVMASPSGNVLAGQDDSNGGDDIFLYDRTFNTSRLISHASSLPSKAGNGISSSPTISADGRYITFISTATDLIPDLIVPVSNKTDNVFLYDRQTETCKLVSHQFDSPMTGQTFGATRLKISANGQLIVFASTSVNLVQGVPPAVASDPRYSKYPHVYAYSVMTGQIRLVDHAFGTSTPGDRRAYPYGVSDDGRFVALSSTSSNLTDQKTTTISNIYRYDYSADKNELITKSVVTGQIGGNGVSSRPCMSADGQFIAFESKSTNLISGYAGVDAQIFVKNTSTGQITLVSHSAANPIVGGNLPSSVPAISADGSLISFSSRAIDLIPGFVDRNGNDNDDVYLYDGNTSKLVLVSRKADATNESSNGLASSTSVSLNEDGRYLLFIGRGTDLVNGIQSGNGSTFGDMYAYDRLLDLVILVNGRHGSTTIAGNAFCTTAAISANGSTIVFSTAANDIMTGLNDVNGLEDVFIRDQATGATSLVSRRFGSPSLSAGGNSTWVQQSADGRFVTFTSYAANHVVGQVDPEFTQDVFLYDRLLNTTALVSHAFDSPTRAADKESAIPVISADGRYVAYTSYASNLIAGFVDGNGDGYPGFELSSGVDVYLYDRLTGINRLVSHIAGAANVGGNQTSGVFYPYPTDLLSISYDGRYVSYFSLANDLVAGFVDLNGTIPANNSGSDVYVYDRVADTNTLVSHKAGAPLTSGNNSSYGPSVSGDGRFIAFGSYANTLVNGMTGVTARNIFVYDQTTGEIALVSHRSTSFTLASDGWSTDPVISNDGNFVVYNSDGSNLVTGQSDANNQDDVFLYNRQTGVNVLVSHNHSSVVMAANAESQIGAPQYGRNAQAISADGRFVVFDGGATDLVNGYVQGYTSSPSDVYLFDRLTGANTLISHKNESNVTGANRNSFFGAVSRNGRVVAFHSYASDLVPNYVNTRSSLSQGDIYLYDRLTGAIRLASHGTKGPNYGGSDLSLAPVLSYDGSVITYLSSAENLVAGDFNSHQDVIAYVQLPSVQSVTIADGSSQRSVVRSVAVSFDQFIPFVGDPALAFEVRNQGLGTSVQVTAAVVNNPNTTVTLTFSGPGTEFGSLVDGKYQLTVRGGQWAGGITNLDGNNDGFAGDDYVFNFHRLFGDAAGNGTVNTVDFNALRTGFGSTAFIFDFNNSGTVDTADFNQFRIRFGASV